MATLQVYISDECWSCTETVRLVADITSYFPQLQVKVCDTAHTPLPENVFAVPTYVLDGRILYLGNPTREELLSRLGTALNGTPVIKYPA